ncbi:hypothetical protein ACO0LV_05330 [Pseudactinotalea sp. Z1739]
MSVPPDPFPPSPPPDDGRGHGVDPHLAPDEPRRRRPRWVPIVAAVAIIALVLGGIAATLNYLAAERERRDAEELEREQTEEADQAARDFFAAVEGHEQHWSAEAVQATYGVEVADAFFRLNLDAAELAEPAADLARACTDQEEAFTAFSGLDGSTRPTLAQVPGSSPSYRSATSAARSSARLAEAEQEYLTTGRDLSEQLLLYCMAWSEAVTAMTAEQSDYHQRMEAVLVPQGQTQREAGWTVECSDPDGCLPVVRADREEYADATVDFYTRMHQVRTALATDHCFDGYEAACEADRALTGAQLEGAETAMDLLRGSLGTGSEALPGYNDALQAWNDEVEDRRGELARILTDMDTDVAPEVAQHFAAHQHVVLGGWQRTIAELAEATLERDTIDRA